MDDLSFDHLVKRLSAQRTRRTSLRALAGGTLAAVALAEASSTDAKKRKKKCKAPRVKCGRKRCCAAGQQCVEGACVTPGTTTIAGGCTSACGTGVECINAECVCNETLCEAATNPIQSGDTCFCRDDFTGVSRCFANQSCGDPALTPCGITGSCPQGFVCLANICGNSSFCMKTCV